jgi:hypothetical protein
MMACIRLVRSPALALTAATLASLLTALPASEAEAQVRRGGGGGARAAAAPRPQAVPAQRPATGAARTGGRAAAVGSGNVQGGSRAASVRGANVQGGNRTVAGSNVAIGNDINVVRPPAGGGYPPAYRPPAGTRPPAYRPPVAVPVYPGYAAPSAGAVIATGLVAGATAGLVSGAMQQPSTTTVVTAPPAAPAGTTLDIGTQLGALPSGCTAQSVGQATYHRCGAAWVQGYMQGSQVVYVVVPAPG